jgi:signal peptidase II
MSRRTRAFVIAFLIALGADQGTKIWARHTLKPRVPPTMTVIPGYWEFEYAENTGSAFSFLRGRPETRWILFGFGIVALGVIFTYLKKAPEDRARLGAELGLLAGGAVGNLLDRGVHGRVTDFVLWHVGAHRWPNFNVADAALVIGIAGLLLDWKPQPKKEPASS